MRRLPVLLLAGLVLAGGCRSLTGRSVGQWVDDATITARVKARLAAERAVNLTRIHVDTYESTVYLTGGVPSVQAKQRAEAIARSVPQVALVVNNLHVVGSRPAASPPGEPSGVPAVLARAGGLARLDLDGSRPGWTRYVGLDAAGRHVATVFVVPVAVLTEQGVAGLTAEAPVEHVGVYPDGPRAWIVLWHRTMVAPAPRLRPESRAPGTEGPDAPPLDVRARVEHHVREANRLAAHLETVLAGDCPPGGPAEWRAFLDGEVERIGRLVAHLDEAWAEARRTQDDAVRRMAKAPRRRLGEARALAGRLEACARASGAPFDARSLWEQVERDLPRRRAEVALPR